MRELYLIDTNDYVVSRLCTSDMKFDRILDNMNEELEDNEVFTIGFNDKEKFISELEGIIRELKGEF